MKHVEKAALKDEEPGRWIVRGAAEDQQEEDLQQVKAGALKAIGSPNWASGPPEPLDKIPETPGVIVMGRARPEPEPVKEVKAEPMREVKPELVKEAEPESLKEKLRKRLQRLKGEVEKLEKE